MHLFITVKKAFRRVAWFTNMFSSSLCGACLLTVAIKAPVDDFFNSVMVNADDPALKANRLGLLATLHTALNRVADLSKLAT